MGLARIELAARRSIDPISVGLIFHIPLLAALKLFHHQIVPKM
jgi:hypothetical protein